MALWEVTDEDLEAFTADLASFVPNRVFDAHAHFWSAPDDWGAQELAYGPDSAGLAQFRQQMAELLPGRILGGIFFGSRFDDGYDQGNDVVRKEIAGDPLAHGHLVVPPGLDPDELRDKVRASGCRGLKVYHSFAARPDHWEAGIEDFLPESYLRVCDAEGWSVTVHIVRSRALADPANQQWITWAAATYPNAKIILAHAGRGFNAYHTATGVTALRGLRNVWYDASAVTEPLPFEAIIGALGPDRLLWGSDYPISHMRGRCVSIGDTFLWVDSSWVDFASIAKHAQIRPYLLIHESLRALKTAAATARLTDSQVEGIFWDNAQAMLAS